MTDLTDERIAEIEAALDGTKPAVTVTTDDLRPLCRALREARAEQTWQLHAQVCRERNVALERAEAAERRADELQRAMDAGPITGPMLIEQLQRRAEQAEAGISSLEAEAERLREAVWWALGENGNFRLREEGDGAYWWRKELRKRTGLPLRHTVQPAPAGEDESLSAEECELRGMRGLAELAGGEEPRA